MGRKKKVIIMSNIIYMKQIYSRKYSRDGWPTHILFLHNFITFPQNLDGR